MTADTIGAGAFPNGADGIDTAAVGDYLRSHGLLADGAAIHVERLSGGVSADVLAVRIDGSAGPREWVLKRALPRLRVPGIWSAAPQRAVTEARAMTVAAEVLPGQVPALVYVDPVGFVTIQQRAHRSLTDWRASLLAGPDARDVETARGLGTALATLHSMTAGSTGMGVFSDLTALVELRIDPFHHTVAAALPDAAPRLRELADELLEQPVCLVHGDFTPKNVLADGPRLQVLDWEVAHLGNPVFDVALLLAHLVCKTVHKPESARGYAECAGEFHRCYMAATKPELRPDDRSVAAHLAAFVLARTDGKSPAAYLTTEQAATARGLALGWLASPPTSPTDVWNELLP